jgi:hypothetical protein
MSKNITEELVTAILREAVEKDHVSPTPLDSLDPMVLFNLRNTVVEFLNDAIPAMLSLGWTPPADPLEDLGARS